MTTTFDDFLKTLKFPPNPFQLDVLKSIHSGSGNIVVSALAGSGKTSLLVQTASLLNSMGETSSLYLAFNVKIREELQKRLPKPHVAVNSHRLGLQVLNSVRKTEVDNSKWTNLAKDIVEDLHFQRFEEYNKRRGLVALCSKVMLNKVPTDDWQAIAGLARFYHIESVYNAEEDRLDERLVGAVKPTIKQAIEIWQSSGHINFDEMLYLPVVLDLKPPQVKWVFIDESQDLNILQQDLAFRSLAEGGRIVAVGDKFQAIYGFSGADATSFQRIIDRAKATVLPLNICYRCPKSHLELARQIVPAIEAAPTAADGVLTYADENKLPELAQAGSMVLCRLNAPLIGAYFKFIAAKIPATVLGRDIGTDLIRTLDRVADLDGFTFDQIIKYLEQYRRQQTHLLVQKENSDQQIEMLNDKMECLAVCVENFKCAHLDDLKADLEKLFGDEDKDNRNNVVTLCSVHKAKGLEADSVFILKPEKMPLVWSDQQPWELEQEMNIKYVAYTRAKKTLTIFGKVPVAAVVPTKVEATNGHKDEPVVQFVPPPPPVAHAPVQQLLLPLPGSRSVLEEMLDKMTAEEIRRTIRLLEAALKAKEVAA